MVNSFNIIKIGTPEPWLIEVATSIGINFSEFTHEITNHFYNHVKKHHGKDNLAVLDTDFKRIPDIVKSPDMAIIGIIRGKALVNAYVKREDEMTFLYFDEVLNSNRNKALRSRTFYKIKKILDMNDFEKIITMNGISDLSKAIKIAVGGHPDEEA